MDNKLIAVFVLLNPCVMMSIALSLPPYQRAQTGRLQGKLFPKEHDFFRNRDDSKPYSWDSFDSEKLSLSGERTYQAGKRFGEDSKPDTGDKETQLQLLRDIVAWEGERLDDLRRAQQHINEKRQRCLAGMFKCRLLGDTERKTRLFPMDTTLRNKGRNDLQIEGRQTESGAQQNKREEVERMLRELDAKLRLKTRNGIFE